MADPLNTAKKFASKWIKVAPVLRGLPEIIIECNQTCRKKQLLPVKAIEAPNAIPTSKVGRLQSPTAAEGSIFVVSLEEEQEWFGISHQQDEV